MDFSKFFDQGKSRKSRDAARPDSMRNRIVLVASGLVAALAVVSALTANWYTWQGARRELLDRNAGQLGLVAPSVAEAVASGDKQAAERLLTGFLTHESVSAAMILGIDGKPLVAIRRDRLSGLSDDALRDIVQRAAPGAALRQTATPLDSGVLLVQSLARGEGQSAGRLAVVVNFGPTDTATLRDLIFWLAEALITVAAVAVVLHHLVGKIVAPLTQLSTAMTELAAGDLGVEIPHRRRKDEIGDLARSIEVFKQGLVDRQNLQSAAETRVEKDRTRRLTLESMIDAFRATVSGLLAQVSSHSEQMSVAADSLSTTARDSHGRATWADCCFINPVLVQVAG